MTGAPGGPSLSQRLAGRLLLVGVRLLQLLPDKPVYRLTYAAGRGLSYLMPERRALVRANLGRVCRSIDATGRASPRVAAAARDGGRLDALVREVFGHWVLTYVESAMLTRYDADALRARVQLKDPGSTAAALRPVPEGSPGPIFVGMHLGSVELGALYAAVLGHLPVSGPMEQVGNLVLRDYFRRTRGRLGMDLLPVRGSAPVLRERILRGEAAALVADRVIGGVGTRVDLFGAPARLPSGPSVLAVETGGPMYVLAVHRRGPGEWAGRLERIAVPATGTRRERTTATLQAQARTFERFIAEAPEQWWTLLFRIWEEDVTA
jgi:lauroyl/myristoyl acyltransferase